MSQPPGLLVLEAPRRGKPPRHLSDMTLAERREAVAAAGLPKFRADQVSNHWFARLVDDPAQWTDIPAAMREPLAESLLPAAADQRARHHLRRRPDGEVRVAPARRGDGRVGADALPGDPQQPERVTMCVSSQAGCGMNCPFCATGQAGLTRNMSTAEIVEQVLAGARALARGRGGGWDRSGLERGLHGHGGAAGQLQRRGRGRAPHDRPGSRRPGDERPRDHRLDRRASSRRCASWPARGCP